MENYGYSINIQEEDIQLQLHVLARAYYDACLALTLLPPAGPHRFENLGVTIEFPKAGRPQ